MNAIAIPIIHPTFENLKKKGRFLHFVAGLLILLNAVHELQVPRTNQLYFWCQLFIGADILIMVFTSRNLVQDLPAINTIFRLIECILFSVAAGILLFESNYVMGVVLLGISAAYGYLLYCERRVISAEMVSFHHTGIGIAGIPNSLFFKWSQINQVNARYDSIVIETAEGRTFQYHFRKNLQFEELDQIHEFCRHYLKVVL